MPHLSYYGLDPIWLSKYLGHRHWSMLHSVPVVSQSNERLYASFFYFYIDFAQGQDQYQENDIVEIDSKLFKYNTQVYRSIHSINNNSNTTTATFESIFVRKDSHNKQLIKSDPHGLHISTTVIDASFIEEHTRVKHAVRNLKISNLQLTKLQFNPEIYFNGVKILYFANYLNLVFQSEYVHYSYLKNPIKTITAFYFGNIEHTDSVYGATIKENNSYTTYLVANNRIIMSCTVTR